MKKLVLLLIVMLLLCVPLFAEWRIGEIIDDFGDPTGEGFVYSLVEGTFSNSATSSSKAFVRIVADFSTSPYPAETWTFEIHDYNWDNPVEDFYDSSSATIKIKEDDGTVTTFTKDNSKYGHYWNKLKAADGYKFTSMLKRNNILKVSITIERYKYNFTIDCSDFNSVFVPYYESLEPNLNNWYYLDHISSNRSFYDELKTTYRSIGITKYFPYGSYYCYKETVYNGSTYLYHYGINNEDYSKNNYMAINLDVYNVSKSDGTPTKSLISSSDIKSVSVIANGKTTNLKMKSSTSYSWVAQQSLQDIVDQILKGAKATLRITTTNNQVIELPLEKDFAEYHEKAKTIEQY